MTRLRLVPDNGVVEEQPGWLYLGRTDIAPGWVYVGATNRDLDEEARELSGILPGGLVISAASRVRDVYRSYAVAQRALQKWQHPDGTSWHQLSVDEAAQIMATVTGGRVRRKKSRLLSFVLWLLFWSVVLAVVT